MNPKKDSKSSKTQLGKSKIGDNLSTVPDFIGDKVIRLYTLIGKQSRKRKLQISEARASYYWNTLDTYRTSG